MGHLDIWTNRRVGGTFWGTLYGAALVSESIPGTVLEMSNPSLYWLLLSPV